jgi:hydroxymethylglutaryl-CoA reductase (NADPH)
MSAEAINDRVSLAGLEREDILKIADNAGLENAELYSRNIENYIGTVKVPVGIAGPLRVNGLFANGDFFVPMATTEAALVASYSRGSRCITAAGGCSTLLVKESVCRSPGFIFKDLSDAGRFVVWAQDQYKRFEDLTTGTSRHCRLMDINITIEGNHVYLGLNFSTGEAAGQNMVTIAAQAICDYIREQSPVIAKNIFVEANLSGDKKSSFLSFQTVRGKKVEAEARIPAKHVEKYLHTTPSVMCDYWRISSIGGSLSGTIGMQGHYANCLAAVYLATGQDVACVSESSVGVTRLELDDNGDLYASVSLPNLIVGTVGGGTGLPSQRACLNILKNAGADNSHAFAEILAALCLGGELSIIGAICAGDFTKAHRLLARGR